MPTASCLLTLLLCLAAASSAYAEEAGDPADLVYITEEYPPFNYRERGKLTGLSVILLKLMWQRMDVPEQPIMTMPWTRAYRMVRTEPHVVIFSAFRTDKRKDMIKWVGPIALASLSVFALRDTTLPVETLDDLAGQRIGTIRGFAATSLLDKPNLSVTISAHAENGIKMLNLNRIDFLILDDLTFHSTVSKMGYAPDHFKRVLTLSRTGLYYLFSKETPDALVARFQKALDTVKLTPGYRNLLNRYLN